MTIVTEMVLSGISGSGTADAAATGVVLVPSMVKTGYGAAFSTALVGAAAVLGPIIPPSIIMVIYASIANVSIARVFLGGVGPGIIIGGFMMALTALMASRRNIPKGDRASLREVFGATRRAFLVLVTPLIVVVGIVGGVFTVTESAGVACMYVLVLGLGVYRTIRVGDLPGILSRAALTTGKVMFILATASVFSWILARGGVPAQVASLPFFSDPSKPWMILLALNVLLLILGCLMEAIAILLIITPMILPIAVSAGIDPVHLGVVMSVNLSIGLITPPFGAIMFVLCGISRVSIADFSRESWPFITVLILALTLITYVPELVLFLPNLIMGGE